MATDTISAVMAGDWSANGTSSFRELQVPPIHRSHQNDVPRHRGTLVAKASLSLNRATALKRHFLALAAFLVVRFFPTGRSQDAGAYVVVGRSSLKREPTTSS